MPVLGGTEEARKFIRQCRALGGTPVPVTHFAGQDWSKEGIVLIRCFGARGRLKGGRFNIGVEKARAIAMAPRGAKSRKLLEVLGP